MTITARQAAARYGTVGSSKAHSWMEIWQVPVQMRVGAIPPRIYCNREFQPVLESAFAEIAIQRLGHLIETYDGCFCERPMRGKLLTPSLHSFAIAIDLNAAKNRLGQPPTMDRRLVEIFEAAGAEWGGRWSRRDGMHFQLSKFPS